MDFELRFRRFKCHLGEPNLAVDNNIYQKEALKYDNVELK